MYPRHNIHSERLLWDPRFENTYFTVLNEFHVENVTYFVSKFIHLWKIGPILLLILLKGPRECIQDIISTVEDFCGIPDLKTRISLFWKSFMSKILPNFSKFLHLCKIGPILLLILLGDQKSVSETKYPQWKTFVGYPIWKQVFHCFEWVSCRKHVDLKKKTWMYSQNIR